MPPCKKTFRATLPSGARKTNVSGEDLRIMGLEPGPAFGRILDAVLAAKLDGTAATPEQQMDLARNLVCSIGAKSGKGNENKPVGILHLPSVYKRCIETNYETTMGSMAH